MSRHQLLYKQARLLELSKNVTMLSIASTHPQLECGSCGSCAIVVGTKGNTRIVRVDLGTANVLHAFIIERD